MRVLIVNNQAAGQGGPGLLSYVRELLARDVEVTIRNLGPTSPVDLATRDAAEFDRVVAAGGDGTVSSVCGALKNTGAPIVVFPAGTGNLTALNLRMPMTPHDMADVTVQGVPLSTDLGEIVAAGPDGRGEAHTFVTAAGAGFDAAIMDGARDLKAILGVGAYFVSAMQILQPTVASFTLDLDGEKVETEGIAVMLVNFSKMLFDLSLAHDSSAHDGMFEVIVIRSKSVAGLIPAVWAAVLDRIAEHPDRSRSLEIHRAASVSVESDPPLPLQHDGDLMESTTPFRGRVLPDAVNFVVPEDYAVSR
ncbi:MAG: diacylglycerol kinase family lipid kinase [Coriobacteriia bacterium]